VGAFEEIFPEVKRALEHLRPREETISLSR
jgi:hypothetical protein